MLKAFVYCLLILCLASCQAKIDQPEPAIYIPLQDKLPPITLYSKNPSQETELLCTKFECHDNVFNYGLFYDLLKDGKHFHDISISDKRIEYEVELLVLGVNHQEGAHYLAEIHVSWNGKLLAAYQYEINKTGKDDQELVAKQLIQTFLTDVKKDQIFDAKKLYNRLQASDYDVDLIYPEDIGEYVFIKQHYYHNPLLGISLNYQDRLFYYDKYDIFIYPVRRLSWNNSETVLTDEINNVVTEIEYAAQKGLWKEVSSEQVEPISIDNQYHGYRVKSQFVNKNNNRYLSSTYIFLQNDKFIKFRMTFPIEEEMVTSPDPHLFVKTILSSIHVPKESAYMKQLRDYQQQRNVH